MKYKAIIFDMDGVLIDSEPVYLQEVIDYIRDDLKIKMNYYELKKKLFKIVGLSDKKAYEIISECLDYQYTASEIQKGLQEKQDELHYNTILNPHILNILPKLKSKGYKLAIASSSPLDNIQRVIKECQINKYFDYIVSGCDFKESKPDPAIYLNVLNKLQLNANQVIAIEDSTYGIQACKNANVKVIAKKDTRFGFEQYLADEIADDMLEVYNIIETLNNSNS